jgi:hypothetical protein
MKQKLFSAAGVLLIAAGAAAATVTWVEVDRTVYQAKFRNWAWYMETASDGKLFTSGWATSMDPALKEGHWIIKRSDDDGATWKIVLDEKFLSARGFGVTSNSSGLIAAAAEVATDPTSGTHWTIRLSHDSGATWESHDDPQMASGKNATAYSSKLLEDGTLLLFGSAIDGQGFSHWLIKRLAPGAQSLETVDDLPASHPGKDAAAGPVAVEPVTGHLLVAGWWDDATGHQAWVVKQSLDQGKTWEFIDIYTGEVADYASFPYQIFFDGQGNPFVLGETGNSTQTTSQGVLRRLDSGGQWVNVVLDSEPGTAYLGGYASGGTIYITGAQLVFSPGPWGAIQRKGLVKRSFDGGKTWENLVDGDLGPYGQGTQYNGVHVNSRGEILVTGTFVHQPDGDEWVVRKLVESGQ